MTLDDLLEQDRQHRNIAPREAHIRETAACAYASFLRAERAKPLSRTAFLSAQLALIQKRWWLAQACLLVLVGLALPGLAELALMTRSLGVAAALFVILAIPEFARNTNTGALEIEGTTHYTLRHIYAARLTLIGGVDLVILTGFCGVLTFAMQLSLAALVTQFLLPLATTAALCFSVLSSPRTAQGAVAVCACLFWGGVWWLIVANDRLYAQAAQPLWHLLLALSLALLALTARRYLTTATTLWEERSHGTLYD